MSDEALLAYEDELAAVYLGDCLDVLRGMPDESVHCVVTSPPYWGLRDYGAAGQLGLEPTPDEYVARMVEVFREVRRVLRSDGTCWLNLGDSYAHGGNGSRDPERWPKQSRSNGGDRIQHAKKGGALKPKELVGIPWRVAFALQADGWYLRSDIIWSKPNAMPESVIDRPTKAHEYLFLLTKAEKYFYDGEAIREQGANLHDLTGPGYKAPGQSAQTGNRRLGPLEGAHGTLGQDGNGMRMPDKWSNPAGRNKRSVWTISTQPYPEAHFATFPEALVEPCVLAGCPADGVVLDPFAGSGTTLAVAKRLGRRSVGIELNAAYLDLIRRRVSRVTYQPALFDIAEAAG